MSEMRIEWREVGRLTPYENNPRANDDAVPAVMASIREFGWRQPIVADADGVIIAGHTRWKAAVEMGLEKVPVLVADDLTPEQVKAYRLADNKTHDLSGWLDAMLAEELAEIENIDMSEFGFEMPEVDLGADGDWEAINETGARPASGFEHRLLIDGFVVPMTDEEARAMMERVDGYVERAGVIFGFVNDLLGGGA